MAVWSRKYPALAVVAIIVACGVLAGIGVGLYYAFRPGGPVVDKREAAPEGTTDNTDEAADEAKSRLTVGWVQAGTPLTSGARTDGRLKVASTDVGCSSLQYYLTGITLCETLETSGTAFNGMTGALEVYADREDDYQTYLRDEAVADAGTKYREVAELKDLAIKLDTVTAEQAALDLQYVVINWMRPVRFTVDGSDHLGTPDEADVTTAPTFDEGTYQMTYPDTNFTDYKVGGTGTQGRAVAVLPNGGYWARLPEAFQLGTTDAWKMIVVYDAVNSVHSYADTSRSNMNVVDSTGTNGFLVNIMPLIPVFYKTSERLREESYRITMDAQGQVPAYDYVLRVYVVESDAEAFDGAAAPPTGSRVVAAMTANVMPVGVDTFDEQVPPYSTQVFYIHEEDDGSWTFNLWDDATPVVKGLTRGVDGTCSIGLFHGIDGVNDQPAGADTQTASKSYTYAGAIQVA